jgi:succinate-semialdehyde dehydrogenase / glutarate-semialdehyde dehydrogenase
MSMIHDVDPATGEPFAEIPCTSPAALEAAVTRARAAQPAWAAMPATERAGRIGKLADDLIAHTDEIAELITREMGKVQEDALGEVRGYAKHVTVELQEVLRAIEPEHFAGGASETVLVREPLGVVAAITPWNFPVGMPLSILIPALATGNTVVFKPSEHVPLVGAKLAELLNQHLPEGVLELVQGEGATGAQLVDSDVDMIGFVGSRATGQHIMTAAARDLKRLVLELGGKDPMVVFGDADLDAAAECAVRHSLRNTGQVCCAVERVYVEDSVADDFAARVVAKAQAWKHGNGFEETSKMGPLVSREQRDKVEEQVGDAVERGADLLLGGVTPDGGGHFYPATVLSNVPADAKLVRDETFGPVVCLSRFGGDEDEAVEHANDTPYGLGANVWTGDKQRGARVAARLKAGQVGVNRYLGGAPGTPWVGARQSGFGFLGGIEGHRQFTSPKTICTA